MIDKKELYKEIDRISYEILDEIISPVCKIPKGAIFADIFLADIGCYTSGDENEEYEILDQICKKYKLESLDEKEYLSPLAVYNTLASMALYIILFGETK